LRGGFAREWVSGLSPARKKKPVIPPVHDWRTTDDDEIERRRLRARAARGIRAARLLLEGELEDEADSPLRSAAMAWAVGDAIEHGRREPAALEDVAKEPETGATATLRAALEGFLRGEGGSRRALLESLADALRGG
jgi:hypothetical protein